MRIKHILALAAGIAAATTMLFFPSRMVSYQAPQSDLERRQEIWIDSLAWCESRGKVDAVNKKDRDGTPSYGEWQFKQSTFAHFAKRYGIASTTDYMDAAAQREIVRGMVRDLSDEELRTRQFPDCIQHKVGTPPRK